MTYMDIVLKVRDTFENADAREIYEHIAVQVNIEGEGSGIFYIEVANRRVVVEPYDYFDRDGIITANAEALVELAEGKMTLQEAVETRKIEFVGNINKLYLMYKLKLSFTK